MEIRLRTPGSTSNLGPGFDALGLALTVYNRVAVRTVAGDGHRRMRITGEGAGKLPVDESNLFFRSVDVAAQRAGRSLPRLEVEMQNGIPLSRGLGSSSTAIVAGVYTANLLMGEPILDPASIDFLPDRPGGSLVGYPLALEDHIHRVTVTSMGNPHCSLMVEDLEKTDWEGLGRLIEVHPCFPRRTNVEFVQVLDRSSLAVRFWERGVGKTLASGTGGCAAVVAACLNGVSDRAVQVHAPGGILQVHWREDNQLSLGGPARIVCQGQYHPVED